MPGLTGLLLAGGYSRRMGQDKAGLNYHGIPQLHYAYQLLRQVLSDCYVSIRAEQRADHYRQKLPQLIDQPGLAGPAAGLLSAQHWQPERSWLVLACDMPGVDIELLRNLIAVAAQQPLAEVVGYPAADGELEPLCSIWRPSPRLAWDQHHANRGLRYLARQRRVHLLTAPEPQRLADGNTPTAAAAIMARLGQTSSTERPA